MSDQTSCCNSANSVSSETDMVPVDVVEVNEDRSALETGLTWVSLLASASSSMVEEESLDEGDLLGFEDDVFEADFEEVEADVGVAEVF